MINKSRPKILVDLEFKSREKLVLKNRSLDLYFNKYGTFNKYFETKNTLKSFYMNRSIFTQYSTFKS